MKAVVTEKENLTEREREILEWIAEGYTNRQIGEKLFVSTKTVDTHRANLMKKLGIHKVTGLVHYVLVGERENMSV